MDSEAIIYAMFSVENNYDQPEYNLVVFWIAKPSLEQVAVALGTIWPAPNDDEHTLRIVKLWQGERIRYGDTDYRIVDIKPNINVEKQNA